VLEKEEVVGSFFPGEPVFLQGDKIPEYFRVLSGRFAKVKSDSCVRNVGVKRMLAEAELLDVVGHQQLFGEIEALMGQPQPFSVFALDESSVCSIPAENPAGMKDVFRHQPQVGVKTCVSFATFLKQFFTHYTNIAKEEVELYAFARKTARDYLAVLNELGNMPDNENLKAVIAGQTRSHEIANELVSSPVLAPESTSVTCGVVRIAGQEVKLQKFTAGSLLCKKGEVGDRLFIIAEGVAEVIIGGSSKNIPIDAPGSIIGEIAVFLNLGSASPNMRRTADVVCATDISAIVVSLDKVEEFFCRQPELMIKMLMAMVERSDNTRKFCMAAEKRLKTLLYDKLGVLLEAINKIGHILAQECENTAAFERPLKFCSGRSREVYNRFRQALATIAVRERIKT
jgi:CRP-like cAMP-binding protein